MKIFLLLLNPTDYIYDTFDQRAQAQDLSLEGNS